MFRMPPVLRQRWACSLCHKRTRLASTAEPLPQRSDLGSCASLAENLQKTAFQKAVWAVNSPSVGLFFFCRSGLQTGATFHDFLDQLRSEIFYHGC